MKERWIKAYTSLLDWEFFFDPLILRTWVYLLLKANHQDEVWHGVVVKRGELVTSLSTLSRELRMSVKQMRRVLGTLKTAGHVTSKWASKYSIITICEYDIYQSANGPKGQADGQADGQANGQHNKNIIEDKEISTNVDKKKKQETKKYSFVVAPEYEAAFTAWLEYKHQRKQTYKSDASLKVCYNKLVKLSGNNPDIAMAIVEQSMANNWAGLFPLKPDYNATATNHNGSDPRRQERANLVAGYAAAISRLTAEDDARASGVRKP